MLCCQNWPFLRKTGKFLPVFMNFHSSSYFPNHVIDPHHFSDFQQLIQGCHLFFGSKFQGVLGDFRRKYTSFLGEIYSATKKMATKFRRFQEKSLSNEKKFSSHTHHLLSDNASFTTFFRKNPHPGEIYGKIPTPEVIPNAFFGRFTPCLFLKLPSIC